MDIKTQNNQTRIVCPHKSGFKFNDVRQRSWAGCSSSYAGWWLLCNYGCSISVFNDSKDALEDFRNNPAAYDLVISDVRMPSLTGDRLAEEILAIKPDIPFVLISGYSPDLDVMRLKRLGVKYFLSKPVENKKLMQIVDEFKSLVNPDKFN